MDWVIELISLSVLDLGKEILTYLLITMWMLFQIVKSYLFWNLYSFAMKSESACLTAMTWTGFMWFDLLNRALSTIAC